MFIWKSGKIGSSILGHFLIRFLRAVASKDPESGASFFFYYYYFAKETLLVNYFKSSCEAPFLRKIGKFA